MMADCRRNRKAKHDLVLRWYCIAMCWAVCS